MSEYLDYDEAVRANRARKKKAMAMKRKRQAQIRLIKRNLFAAILLLVISVVVTKSVKAISSHADDSNAQQQAVLTDNVIEDNNITALKIKPKYFFISFPPYFDTFTIYLSDIVPSFVVFSAFNITGPGSG